MTMIPTSAAFVDSMYAHHVRRSQADGRVPQTRDRYELALKLRMGFVVVREVPA